MENHSQLEMKAEGPVQDQEGEIEKQLKKLQEEKAQQDKDFGIKRAKFKEIFIQKEDELKRERDRCELSEAQVKQLQEGMERLKSELEGVRTAAAVSESNKQEEITDIINHHKQEVANLEQLLKEASDTAEDNTAARYETERNKLVSLNENYEEEIQELRNKLSQERDGFLSTVAKQIKRVGAVAGNTLTEHENLEESMRKAQENAEMLKSVVVPLETEIKTLKAKLEERDLQLSQQTTQQNSDVAETTSLADMDEVTDPSEKVEKLMVCLKAEKAARTDLEMYVTVLSSQKGVLQDEADRLGQEMKDVCRLLEEEQASHESLKQTWQMANDQFLEAQRLMMMDLRRMEGVLSTEQQRQVAELQQKDEEREAQKRKVKELEERREKQEREQEEKRKLSQSKRDEDDSEKKQTDVIKRASSLIKETSPVVGSVVASPLPRSASGSLQSDEDAPLFLDSGVHDTVSLPGDSGSGLTAVRISPEKVLNLPSLSAAQMKAITDPTPESEAHKSLMANVRTSQQSGPALEGKRMVSEREWGLLQEEMRSARDKLGRPCSMCHNYEAQLQASQSALQVARVEVTRLESEVKRLETELQSESQTSANLVKYQEELEEALKQSSEDTQEQISGLSSKLHECESFIQEMKIQMSTSQADLDSHCNKLTSGREEVQKQLIILQEENDSLVGKHSKTAQQLQNEDINLPNNLEEMQLLLLKYREEIISAKVAKEHTEETLRSEILFLKSQVVGEQQEKTTLEETLSQEITALQGKIGELNSVQTDLTQEKEHREAAEARVKDCEAQLKSIQTKSKQIISKMEEGEKKKTKLEAEVHSLRGKVSSLQVDLDNSEAVQRDFVKLSQSLQIQLEKIRQAETEVRWQHEDDIDDCNNCKQPFSVTKRKHHCRHCGRVFCSECTTKSVSSGPNTRPAKVCDVCHTILVKDATPYFSTEPPPTPD